MAALDFPANPTAGQVYEGDNGVIYTYVGTAPNGHWSAFSELSSESFADIFVEVKGDNMTGDLTLGTDKITLNAADGSITAAGGNAEITSGGAFKGTSVQTPGNVNNGAIDGAMLSQSGFVYASRTGNSAVWRGYTTGISTPTTEILSDGTTYIGGTIPSAPNIELNADGSITAAGDIQSDGILLMGTDSASVNCRAVFQGRNDNPNTTAEIYLQRGETDIINNNGLGKVLFGNRDSHQGAYIWALGDDTWSGSSYPTKLRFGTTTTGATSPTTHLEISSDGSVNATGDATFEGDVKIGGVLPDDPSITLNADGDIITVGDVGIGTTPTTGRKLHVSGVGTPMQVDSSDSNVYIRFENSLANEGFIGYKADALVFSIDTTSADQVQIDSSGSMGIGGLLPSSPNITLNADGSASFQSTGVVINDYLGGDIAVYGDRTGGFNYITRTQINGFAALSDSSPKFSLNNADGLAVFKGGVKIGVLSSAPNIDLRADGSIITTGQIVSDRTSTSDTCFTGRFSGTTTTAIRCDGTILVGGQSPGAGVSNTRLNPDGSATFAGGLSSLRADGGATFGASIQVGSDPNTGNATGTKFRTDGIVQACAAGNGSIWQGFTEGTSSITSEIFADGSATFAGSVSGVDHSAINGAFSAFHFTQNNSIVTNSVRDNSGSIFLNTVTSDGSVFIGNKSGSGGNYGASNNSNITLNTDGSATFASNITADNVTFNLEADDDTKYTATTNEDGEQTLVYNGAVLDVKDRLQKTDAALTALKSAAAAASDFAALKSAIATALADI